MNNPLRSIRQEAQAFRTALAEAPEPSLPWDVLGARRLMRRLGWLLMREHTEPGRLALAVLVGVMIGASPFYGLHTALVLLFAFGLRLNKLAVWIASNVSLPFIAPLLIFVSVQIGHVAMEGAWLPLTLDGARAMASREGVFALGIDLWLNWLVGSVPVGVVLGSLLAGVTYRVALARQQGPGDVRS